MGGTVGRLQRRAGTLRPTTGRPRRRRRGSRAGGRSGQPAGPEHREFRGPDILPEFGPRVERHDAASASTKSNVGVTSMATTAGADWRPVLEGLTTHDGFTAGGDRRGARAAERAPDVRHGGRDGNGRRQHLLQPADARPDPVVAGRRGHRRPDSHRRPARLRDQPVLPDPARRHRRPAPAHRHPVLRPRGRHGRRRAGAVGVDPRVRLAAGGRRRDGGPAAGAVRRPPGQAGAARPHHRHRHGRAADGHPAQPDDRRLRGRQLRLARDVLAGRADVAGGRRRGWP